jgi:transcriptional regulator with XRE-family HTH domain
VRPDDLAAAIKRVMASRGLSTREVVRRVPRRHVGTVYRLLAGRTTDPWASTVVSLCSALNADPDELLGVEDAIAILDPELRLALSDIERLEEEDRWLALDMLRSVLARRLHGIRGPKRSTPTAPVEEPTTDG